MGDFKEVSHEAFFEAIGPLDVHPSVFYHKEKTIWELKNGTVVGISFPGWKNPGDEKKYFLHNSLTF